MQSDLHASECECVCTFGSMCNSFLLLYNDMQLSCMFDPPPQKKNSSACMGCQTQSNFPAPLANFLSPSELISNLFAWVFQLWIALVSNMGVLGLNISAYRCGQLCTVLALICAFVKISANWNLRGSLYILYRQQRSQHWDKNVKGIMVIVF